MAGLEARGFERAAEELTSFLQQPQVATVELVGPAEINAALEANVGDAGSAADALLGSKAFTRRAMLLEVRLRAQDALCAAVLGPSVAAAADVTSVSAACRNASLKGAREASGAYTKACHCCPLRPP